MSTDRRFPHHALDAWWVAVEARRRTLLLLAQLPTGFGADAGQLRRSSGAVPKLIAEGACRPPSARGDKRRRFEEAGAEAGETASGLEELVLLEALPAEDVHDTNALWGRVVDMATGLQRRWS